MSKSSQLTLNDICEFIADCLHKTAPIQETGYPSIRTPNIGRGRLILENVNRVSEETYLEWIRRATPQGGDLIIAREAPVGNVAIIPDGLQVCLGQRTVLARPDRNKVEPDYLVYLLLGDEIQGKFQSYSGGATVAHLNVKDIRDLELPPLPSRETQRKIAAILSAYDDLIENNTQRIQALEAAAQALYREWFVEFRFPGHESVAFVPSELGDIPAGWEIGPVSEFIEINPRVSVHKDNEYPFVPMANLSENSMLITGIEYRVGNSGAKFKNNDTLFARITPCLENGKTGFVQFLDSEEAVATGSTEFVVMRSKHVCPEYVYCLARLPEFREAAAKSMTGATGRQRVSNSFFDEFLIVLPQRDMIASFREATLPVFKEIQILAHKNAVLREARDLLLPRLISGELDVARLEIELDIEPS